MASFEIAGRKIGPGHACYIIAEISCNHEGDIEEAKRIIKAAAEAGCDAVKTQTYTADTMSRNFKTSPKGTIWENINLYELYKKAYTPWEWYTELQKEADKYGLHIFSSPFDETAVDFLEKIGVPVYKIASFEIVDTKLLEKVASTGKPVIISSGMSEYAELDEAITVLRDNGAKNIALLKCNSGYPGDFAEVNLATIPVMKEKFGCVIGLSDHTIFADPQMENCRQPVPIVSPLEAVKLGAHLIETHLMMDREKGRKLMEKNQGGFDWPFSRTPEEMKEMVDAVRAFERGENVEYKTEAEREMAKKAIGMPTFTPTPKEMGSRNMRPSLWVVEDIKEGEELRFAGGKKGNIDSIRPGGGLHIRYADEIHGRKAKRAITAGTPLSWDMVA